MLVHVHTHTLAMLLFSRLLKLIARSINEAGSETSIKSRRFKRASDRPLINDVSVPRFRLKVAEINCLSTTRFRAGSFEAKGGRERKKKGKCIMQHRVVSPRLLRIACTRACHISVEGASGRTYARDRAIRMQQLDPFARSLARSFVHSFVHSFVRSWDSSLARCKCNRPPMSLSFRDQDTNCVPEKRLRTRAWLSHEATARTREERQICVFTIANKRDPNGKAWNSNVLAGLRNNFRCLIPRESNLVSPEGDYILGYARAYRCFIHGRRLFAINHIVE